MAFVRIDTIELIRMGHSSHSTKRIIVCSCDQCKKEFTRKYTKKNADAAMNRPRFCSKLCTYAAKKYGGIMYETIAKNLNQEKARKTLLKRYGVTNPGQLRNHREKCKKSLLEHYGVDCVFNIPYVNEKIRRAAKSIENLEKRKKTCLKKYGAENVYASNYGKEKIQNTMLERYGVKHVAHIPGMSEKRKNTIINQYNCTNIFQRNDVRNNARQTIFKKYGSYTFWQSEKHKEQMCSNDFLRQRHETMKRNGTYRKSKSEDECYRLLCEKFGVENIARQVQINGWLIDFYVKSTNTYVQFDGVYWHGLDRPFEEICKHLHSRDKIIHTTHLRDQKQNMWFKEHNVRLIRITDIEMKRTGIATLLPVV